MKQLLKLVSPFKKLTPHEKLFSTVAIIIVLLTLWSLSGSAYLPKPMEIFGAFPKLLTDRDLIGNLGQSLAFCAEAILYSTIISLFVCYLSVLPMFSTFCELLRKFRFLPSVGLSFLFMKITNSQSQQMMWIMVFGVTTWLLDSMVGIALNITDDEIMYARSLRLSRWQTMKEILIFGKAADLFGAIISNFAMAWMLLAAVENIAKANGGLGVALSEASKYYKFEQVYAIQIVILVTGTCIDLSLRWLRGLLFPYTKIN